MIFVKFSKLEFKIDTGEENIFIDASWSKDEEWDMFDIMPSSMIKYGFCVIVMKLSQALIFLIIPPFI